MSVSNGWALYLRANPEIRGDKDLGPLGWGWANGYNKRFDDNRPDGACQVAVFRSRRLARLAMKGQHFSARMYVKRVRVIIEDH